MLAAQMGARRPPLSPEQAQRVRNLIHASRVDFNIFADFIGPSMDSRFLGQAPLHLTWQRHLDAHQWAGIIAPQFHGKTTQMMLRVLWELGRNPELLVKYISCSDDLAADRVFAFRHMIQHNKRLRMVFPHLVPHPHADDWTTESFTILRRSQIKDSSLSAHGILTAGSGGRADLIVFDDVVDMRNAVMNPENRGKVKKFFWHVWMKTLAPEGRAWYINTMWDEEDLTNEIMKNEQWHFRNDSINDALDPVWPERWNRSALEKALSADEESFRRGMQNRVVSETDMVLDPKWLTQFCPHPVRGSVRISSWDFAPGKRANSDRTANAVIDVFPEHRRLVFIASKEYQGLTIQGVADTIRETHRMYVADVEFLQAVSFEVYVSQSIEPSWGIPVETWSPAMSKRERARILSPWFSRGHVWFAQNSECEKLAKRMGRFTGKEGQKDDDVDAALGGVKRAVQCFSGSLHTEQVESSGEKLPVAKVLLDKWDESDGGSYDFSAPVW